MPEIEPRDLREPGDHRVDIPVICVMTRLGFRNPWQLLQTWREYHGIASRAASVPGFLHSTFLFETRKTCVMLSFWSTPRAVPHFGTEVESHVHAARRAFGRLSMRADRTPEVWSAKWRLASVSNNLNWAQFDLRGHIVDWSRQQEVVDGPGH